MMSRSSSRATWIAGAVIVVLVATLLVPVDITAGERQPYLHMNPVIEKLEQGLHVFGAQARNLSLQHALALASADIDYIYIDGEHTPLRWEEMAYFIAFLTAAGRPEAVARGNMQASPAVFARFPPSGWDEQPWMYKHGLDIGLMGILLNNIETAEQALNVVRTIRPTPTRDSRFPDPPGQRGSVICGFWAPPGECRKRGDLWPLNPEGDLIFWPMMETVESVRNADEIAQVPGVSGFYFGRFGDLTSWYGGGRDDPEFLAGIETLLNVCRTRDIACGGTVNAENAALRVSQGYRILNFGQTGVGLTGENAAARDAVLEAGVRR